MHINDNDLAKRISRFAPRNRLSYLEYLRPQIISLYLEGYSLWSIFRFLKHEGRIDCSKTGFYDWLKAKVNLDEEVRQAVAAKRDSAKQDLQAERPAAAEQRVRSGSPRSARKAPSDGVGASAGANFACEIPGSSGSPTAEDDRTQAGAPGTTESQAPENFACEIRSSGEGEETTTTTSAAPLGHSSTEKTTVESPQATTQDKKEADKALRLSRLRAGIKEMEQQQMGAVADRALARLQQRDLERERGKGGS